MQEIPRYRAIHTRCAKQEQNVDAVPLLCTFQFYLMTIILHNNVSVNLFRRLILKYNQITVCFSNKELIFKGLNRPTPFLCSAYSVDVILFAVFSLRVCLFMSLANHQIVFKFDKLTIRRCTWNIRSPGSDISLFLLIAFYRNINSFYRIIISLYRIIIAIYRNNYSDISIYYSVLSNYYFNISK